MPPEPKDLERLDALLSDLGYTPLLYEWASTYRTLLRSRRPTLWMVQGWRGTPRQANSLAPPPPVHCAAMPGRRCLNWLGELITNDVRRCLAVANPAPINEILSHLDWHEMGLPGTNAYGVVRISQSPY